MPPFFRYVRSRTRAIRVLCLAGLVVCCNHGTLRGQATVADAQFVAGRDALASSNYDRAIELFRRSLDHDDRNPEVHYLLAQAYLATHQIRDARTEIGRARSIDEKNLKFAVAEMEILRASTPRESSISLTDGRRETLANTILERDPDNPAALEELGLQHAMNYRWYANFDATKRPLGGGIARRARREFDEASDLLRRSIAADATRTSAYAELLRLFIEEGEWTMATELAESAIDVMPSSYMSWLLAGLVAQLQNQSEAAQPLFEKALELMTGPERRSFTDPSLFLDEREQARFRADPHGFSRRYWSERDPFKLTDVNEREMDHYARLAFCKLWYGGDGSRGWDTERGRIVVRYGIPWSDASFVAGYSRFNALEYRDFAFVFEDVTRGGHYTMYSPKASSSSSWENDYVIQAGEMAKSTPELYDPKFLSSVDLLAETTFFRGSGGASDIYVHIRIPSPDDSIAAATAAEVGAFLMDENGKVVDRASASLDDVRPGVSTTAREVTKTLRGKAGPHELEVEYLSDDRSTAGHLRLDLEIPSFEGDTLSVSDLLPASAIEGAGAGQVADAGRIRRHGYAIEPMPWVQVKAGSDLLVYFEFYGLEMNEGDKGRYRISALLEKKNSGGLRRFLSGIFGGGEGTKVAASIESKSETSDEARFISLALPPDLGGEYRLVLEVTDLLSGRTVTRAHDLSVVH